MNPLLATFLKLTLAMTAAVVAIVALFFILKIVLVAAGIAGLAIGVLFLVNMFRRPRPRLPPGGRRRRPGRPPRVRSGSARSAAPGARG